MEGAKKHPTIFVGRSVLSVDKITPEALCGSKQNFLDTSNI